MAQTLLRMNPASLPDAGAAGYSQITVAEPGRMAYISGQVAWRRDGGPIPTTLVEQAKLVIHNAQEALHAVGASPHDIVLARLYMLDVRPEAQHMVMPLLLDFFDGAQPSLTGIGVAALAAPDLLLELELIVRLP